jgi:adenine-specific DNA-methyltransferase
MKATEIPHIIKYMGSKRNIMKFVEEAIESVINDDGQRLYDVFGGSGVVSAAFRDKLPVTCNDIQEYTSILGKTYLQNYMWQNYPDNILEDIVFEAEKNVNQFKKKYSQYSFKYDPNLSFDKIQKLESDQRELLNHSFNDLDHLFVKSFSGTYWSYEQNVWIDAISAVARNEKYKNSFLYEVIISSLMFAMAYCTQSTGHYAQYRDLTTDNLKDILSYRNKTILPLFKQKFVALKEYYNGDNNTLFDHEVLNLDFIDLINNIEQNSIIYADPPYQFVHYSRFYHALETLSKYDYPQLLYKGRYRTDRHQSPFCVKTKVKGAFQILFQKANDTNSSLVLSYSNTGMISLEELEEIGNNTFIGYESEIRTVDYKHSTMGRQGDKTRDVSEAILIFKPI